MILTIKHRGIWFLLHEPCSLQCIRSMLVSCGSRLRWFAQTQSFWWQIWLISSFLPSGFCVGMLFRWCSNIYTSLCTRKYLRLLLFQRTANLAYPEGWKTHPSHKIQPWFESGSVHLCLILFEISSLQELSEKKSTMFVYKLSCKGHTNLFLTNPKVDIFNSFKCSVIAVAMVYWNWKIAGYSMKNL